MADVAFDRVSEPRDAASCGLRVDDIPSTAAVTKINRQAESPLPGWHARFIPGHHSLLHYRSAAGTAHAEISQRRGAHHETNRTAVSQHSPGRNPRFTGYVRGAKQQRMYDAHELRCRGQADLQAGPHTKDRRRWLGKGPRGQFALPPRGCCLPNPGREPVLHLYSTCTRPMQGFAQPGVIQMVSSGPRHARTLGPGPDTWRY